MAEIGGVGVGLGMLLLAFFAIIWGVMWFMVPFHVSKMRDCLVFLANAKVNEERAAAAAKGVGK